MNTRLGAVALLVALTACSTPAPPPAPAAAPKLRDLATVDACTLLAEPDFGKPFTKAPEPLNEPLSCRWSIEGQIVWMSVENESLEQAKIRVNEGSDLTVEGRKAWWGVETDFTSEPSNSIGVTVTELAADRVLVMTAEKIPGNYDVGSVARTSSVAVVQRLFS
ncbi:hypothetical protein SK854_12445 [Lentzea sp. BCCO 10_0061]|uniref:DUF3558 domain-containing protein n=1 Tax=Lentzea sokolovensis TaxID=3095429 RepID=A0ABU4UTU0_9PSEU|nr:hypothetical protein [Lentzea sp. BCCO 10_0061]MDX8142928.1 hypothetical protein [Lentzea sp. BCCO 10_0061]